MVALTLYTGHFAEIFGTGKADAGGFGASFSDVLDDMKTWIAANQSEVVFLRLSHIKDNLVDKVTKEVRAKIKKKYLYHGGRSAKRPLAHIRIQEMRGKIVVAATANFNEEPLKGIHRYYKYDPNSPGKIGLVTCGAYSDTTDYNIMKNGRPSAFLKKGKIGQSQQMASHGAHLKFGNKKRGRDHFFTLYWTLTGGNILTTPQPALTGLSVDLPAMINNPPAQTFKTGMPNVVFMDFIDATRCQNVYTLNTFP